MNSEAIELLCQKLGTTLDKLVPAVIQFGIHDAKISLMISIIILTVGIGLIITGICIANRDKYLSVDNDMQIIMPIFFGAICFVIGLVILIICIVKLHYWNTFPELQAYKMILKWISGNNS